MNILEIIWVLGTIFLIGFTIYLAKKRSEDVSYGLLFLIWDLALICAYYRDFLTTPLW